VKSGFIYGPKAQRLLNKFGSILEGQVYDQKTRQKRSPRKMSLENLKIARNGETCGQASGL